RVIDARGMLITPGFIDAHVHFLQGGLALASVQLRDADTPAEFSRRIAERAASMPRGRWITHGDWDHERWGGALPRRDWIDAVTPDHPVWVNRHDSHMSLANSAALRAAGVTRDTGDVAGGTIVRDVDGEPTGLFKDNARLLVDRAVPPPTDAEHDAALDAAMRHVAANGVTAVHHMGTWEDLASAIEWRPPDAATPGSALARSRASSTDRWGLIPRRCSNRTPTRRTIAGCS